MRIGLSRAPVCRVPQGFGKVVGEVMACGDGAGSAGVGVVVQDMVLAVIMKVPTPERSPTRNHACHDIIADARCP